MTSGNITTGTYTLILANQAAASLNYTSGRIIGKFQRGINAIGTYLFPIGTVTNYNPANLIINVVPTAGSVLSEFIANDPGNSGLPQTDGAVVVAETYPDGYWSFTANTFSCGNYSINLDAAGFSPAVDNYTRIVKRTSGGDWGLDGTHGAPVGSVCYRNNLSGDISSSGTHFALGRKSPVIIDQPDDLTVCEGSDVSFSVTANGLGTLTYQWYKDPLTLLADGGHFGGTTTQNLTISNVVSGDAGSYYCVVNDGIGNTAQSTDALLSVRANPVITVQPVAPAAVCEGTGTQVMTVTATGYTLSYQWQEYQGAVWNNVVNGGVYSGATTSSLTLTSPALVMNGYQYRVIVTGGCGAPVTSSGVAIVVRANPVITVQPVAPAAVCEGTGTQVMTVTATGYTLSYQWQEYQGAVMEQYYQWRSILRSHNEFTYPYQPDTCDERVSVPCHSNRRLRSAC